MSSFVWDALKIIYKIVKESKKIKHEMVIVKLIFREISYPPTTENPNENCSNSRPLARMELVTFQLPSKYRTTRW